MMITIIKHTLTPALLICFSCNLSYANDSIARIAAGGLVFEQTNDIEMVSEHLEISTTEISVDYLFHNHSKQDVNALIAFPIPLREWDAEMFPGNRFNPGSFYVHVNGKKMSTHFVREAIFDGVDITAKLRDIGLSESQIFEFEGCDYFNEEKGNNICNFTAKQVKALAELGIHDDTLWNIQETFVWRQIFPGGADTKVAHVYTPAVGGYFSFSRLDNAPDKSSDKNIVSYMGNTDEACVDEGTSRAIATQINQLHETGVNTVAVLISDVEYILGTGRNWRGPIRDFYLRVKKSLPDEVISLCFPGRPKKVNALTYEFHQKDYYPQNSVLVKYFSFTPMER